MPEVEGIMSRTTIKASLVAMLLAAAMTATAGAQQFQPFIDPDYFHPDFQFFAPAELNEYGGESIGRTGWFATYDRLYIYVSRPQGEASYTDGDFTWGNRFDVGYMTEENHGWAASILHIDGPNANDILVTERIDRYLAPTTQGGGGGGGGNNANNGPTFPAVDRNDPFTGERTYNVTQSLNVATLSNFELNKTFRLDPLHRGSILEPFLGVRYNKFVDHTRRDQYERFDDTGNLVPTLPNANQALDDATIERFTSNNWTIINNMVGGQLGVRWYGQHSRWQLDSDFRAFAMQNFQSMNYMRSTETTLFGGGGGGGGNAGGSSVTMVLNDRTREYDHGSEFVFGFEARASAAYQVTRDFSLRFGLDVLDYAAGVGRGNNFSKQNEDVLMVGATFGFTLNR